jgi:hypothetical protein
MLASSAVAERGAPSAEINCPFAVALPLRRRSLRGRVEVVVTDEGSEANVRPKFMLWGTGVRAGVCRRPGQCVAKQNLRWPAGPQRLEWPGQNAKRPPGEGWPCWYR